MIFFDSGNPPGCIKYNHSDEKFKENDEIDVYFTTS